MNKYHLKTPKVNTLGGGGDRGSLKLLQRIRRQLQAIASQMWRTPLLVAVGIKTRVQIYNSFLDKL
jgi:hypothetical protein